MKRDAWWMRSWMQLRAGRPFPAPGTCKGGPTYLSRYPEQFQLFRERLPRILSQKLAQQRRSLTVGVVGSATGEEMASLLASVIRAFDDHPDWGDVESWQVQVRGIEVDPDACVTAQRRLAGLEPLLAHEQHLAHSGAYWREVAATMSALNKMPRWSKRSFQCFVADAYATEGLRDLKDSDVLFFNSAFLTKERLATGVQLARDFSHAYIFSTEAPSEFPPIGAGDTHRFEVFSDPSRRVQCTIATPAADAPPPPAQKQPGLEEAQETIRLLLSDLAEADRKLELAAASQVRQEAQAAELARALKQVAVLEAQLRDLEARLNDGAPPVSDESPA